VTAARVGQTAAPPAYRTLLVDPPWDILQVGGCRRGAVQHHPLLSVEAIARLPVLSVAADRAHLWLWVTNAGLFAGQVVLERWGFTYRSILTWIKPFYGMGRYMRSQTQHLLLGTRGRAPVHVRGQGSWFYAPVQGHSRKPEEQYAVIERCSPGPYLGLFARRRRPGWHAWGDEVSCDVLL
jgi:N6-adenosine-specific RNA methylase IME4